MKAGAVLLWWRVSGVVVVSTAFDGSGITRESSIHDKALRKQYGRWVGKADKKRSLFGSFFAMCGVDQLSLALLMRDGLNLIRKATVIRVVEAKPTMVEIPISSPNPMGAFAR